MDNALKHNDITVAELRYRHWWKSNINVMLLLQRRQNERDGVSNHQRLDCLLNLLFRRRSKKTQKLCVTGFCEGNWPMTTELPVQRASNAGMFPFDDVIMEMPERNLWQRLIFLKIYCTKTNSSKHYDDVIMSAIASRITSFTTVYLIVHSRADQRKHQSSASLAFVREFTGGRWIPRTKGQ